MTRADMQKLPTGIPGLDELLNGGMLPDLNIMIEGEPGTGKSTMAMQYLLAGIEMGEPGVYITLEETPSRIYRDAASYGWDFHKLEKDNMLRVIATSPTAIIEQIEKRGPLVDIIREIDAKRAIIDTISVLQIATSNTMEFRLLLASLIRGLERENLRALLIRDSEPASGDPSSSFWSRYSADILVSLKTETQHGRLTRRAVQVTKSRGQSHIGGIHAYIIDGNGVTIFPRTMPTKLEKAILPAERIASGVPGLDEMLHGGFIQGECILASGPAGSGKTISAIRFLAESAIQGEPALMLSTEEHSEGIISRAQSVGIDIKPLVEKGLFDIDYIIESEISLDEYLFHLRKRLEEKPYARVAIDSLNTIERISPDPAFVPDAILYLGHLITSFAATTYLTNETQVITGNVEITHVSMSVIADTIILFRLVEIEGDIKKVLSILKHRGSAHATDIRQVMIDKDGMRVLSGFEGYQGVLTGVPVILPSPRTQEPGQQKTQ